MDAGPGPGGDMLETCPGAARCGDPPAGESSSSGSATRDTLIRGYMAGAIISLGAAFAVTVTVQTGQPLAGAILFPVGFCLLILLGFDMLTGVFMLVPLALIDRRPGVTVPLVLRNWGWVFLGNFAGALTVALPPSPGLAAVDHVDQNGQRVRVPD